MYIRKLSFSPSIMQHYATLYIGQVGSSSLMCASYYCGHAEVARCCIGARVDITLITLNSCAQISTIAFGVMHFPIIVHFIITVL